MGITGKERDALVRYIESTYHIINISLYNDIEIDSKKYWRFQYYRQFV